MEEVRAEREQGEKINAGDAIHVAYVCNTEMKLTRHLSVHMAERRENHPVTLHPRAKKKKNNKNKNTTVLLWNSRTDAPLEVQRVTLSL